MAGRNMDRLGVNGSIRGARVGALATICGTALGVGLAGCAGSEKPAAPMSDSQVPQAFVRIAPFDPGDRPISEPVVLSARGQAATGRLVSRQQMTAPATIDPTTGTVVGGAGDVRRVKISVADAKVQEVVHALLGPDGLGKSYVLDPDIQKSNATITMDVDEEMTTTDIRDLLDGLARFFGWSVQERDNVVYVRPTNAMAQDPGAPILEAMATIGDQTPVIRVRRMRYLGVADVQKLLEGLLSEGGKAAAVGQTLILIDTSANANRLSRLLSALDVPAFSGVEIWTYALGSRDPGDAATLLTEISDASRIGRGPGEDPLVAFVPIPGTSRLMVISRDPTVQTYVQDLIQQIDQPPELATRQRYLYRIQYLDPQALMNMITSFFADRIESAAAGAGGGGPRVQQGAGPGGPGGASPSWGGMRLTLEPQENLLLVQATPEDYADLVATLRMVDRPRQQVVLSSIIAEVRLNDSLEYGVEYFLRAFDIDGLGIMELAGGTSDLITGVPSASAFFTGADGFAIIKALETVSEVNVLAQPQLTAMDGEQARILVGGRTPVPEGNIDTTTGGLRNDITYEDVGIELTIEAKINESGDVTLNIRQSINDVVGQSDLGPEFTTREIETNVTVPHGRTLLLGGIIEIGKTINERKIPFLADIPGVGAAFKSVVDQQERNELVLAVTPTIVNSPASGYATMGTFLQAARGIERALYTEMDSLPQGSLNTSPPALPPVREELGATPPENAAPTEDPSAMRDAPGVAPAIAPVEGADEAQRTPDFSSAFVGPIEGAPVSPTIVGVLADGSWSTARAAW